MPRGYPYFQAHPTQPISPRVDDLTPSPVRFYPQPSCLDTKQHKEATDLPVSLSSSLKPNNLCVSPYSTEANKDPLGRINTEQAAIEYSVSCFLDSQNITPPLQFRAYMLQLLAAIEASTRQPLSWTEDQPQPSEVSLLTKVAEDLFGLCKTKVQAFQNEIRTHNVYSKSTHKAQQKVRKVIKREGRLSLDGSVRRNNRKYRPLFHGLTRSRLTCQQAFRALPLVIKCLPEPLKRRLVAKAKTKAFKMAATLLNSWCL